MRRRCLGPALLVLCLAAGPASAARAATGQTAALQVALRAVGLYAGTVDGVGGPGTRAALRRFQRRHRLAADGVAGPATRRALGRRGRPSPGRRTIQVGDRGWDVAALQFAIQTHGFPLGHVDGGFGPHAVAALRRFQRWAGLRADGVAGPSTLAALARPAPRSPLVFAVPLAVPVGDRFGPRADGFHPGIDFPARSGTRVGAAGRGCVSFAGYDPGGYGNLVVVSHRFGMTSWYAHLSRIDVRRGTCMTAGRRIGSVGSTGLSTGPHLHFELRLRGAAVPPRF